MLRVHFLRWRGGRLLLSVVMAAVAASVFVNGAVAVAAVGVGELGAEREGEAQAWRTLSSPECSVDGLERVQTGGFNLRTSTAFFFFFFCLMVAKETS